MVCHITSAVQGRFGAKKEAQIWKAFHKILLRDLDGPTDGFSESLETRLSTALMPSGRPSKEPRGRCALDGVKDGNLVVAGLTLCVGWCQRRHSRRCRFSAWHHGRSRRTYSVSLAFSFKGSIRFTASFRGGAWGWWIFTAPVCSKEAQRSGIQFYMDKNKGWCAFCISVFSVSTSKSPCRARDVMSLIVVHLHLDTDIRLSLACIQSQSSQSQATSEPLKWFLYALWETLEKLCRMVIRKEWVFGGVPWAAITYRSTAFQLLTLVGRGGSNRIVPGLFSHR